MLIKHFRKPVLGFTNRLSRLLVPSTNTSMTPPTSFTPLTCSPNALSTTPLPRLMKKACAFLAK